MKSGLGQWLVIGGLVLTLAGSCLIWRSLRNGPLPAGEVPGVTVMRDAATLPAFALQGSHGEFSNANLAGRWSFMFFGYTRCPDVCPTALTLMKDVKAALLAQAAAPPAPTFQVIFVSVDPRRDTRQLLDEYMAAFDPSFIGVSGDDAALAALTKSMGVHFQRNDSEDTERYTVDHSAAIHLIDPQGRLAAAFPPPQEAQKLAADYQRITRN